MEIWLVVYFLHSRNVAMRRIDHFNVLASLEKDVD